MFGLTIDKIMIIAIIAVFVIGPQRLPAYAGRLARLVRSVRQLADGAKVRLREELGPEFDEVDWVKLDPRQYDPRRIIREALLDGSTPTISAPSPHHRAESASAPPISAADQLNSPSTTERN